MAATHMVPLVTAFQGFHAQVIAARLAAAGVATQLRGSVTGPYPVGEVVVLVEEADLAAAAELLLADEIEDAFEPQPQPQRAAGLHRPWVMAVAVLVVAACSVVVRLA
ncbi:MAG: hypothetical protein ACRD0F_00535 [Acidimicrobiales bacterium]